MNKISILSINIVDGNYILNKNGLPILFYWNKEDNLKNCLSDDSFKSLVLSLCQNDKYTTSKIKCVAFIDEDIEIDGNEKYETVEYNVQDIFPIIENEIIAYRIIISVVHSLYISIFKKSSDEEYQNNSLDSLKNAIHNMYKSIIDNNQDKISANTIFYYIISKILQINNLNKNNLYSIIKTAKQTLKF